VLADPECRPDIIFIDVDLCQKRPDQLDLFDIIHTVSTLIKSNSGSCTTKIVVIVNETTSVKLIKEVINQSEVTTVGWLMTHTSQFQTTAEWIQQLLAGSTALDPRVQSVIKPQRKIHDPNTHPCLTYQYAAD
jgi:phenylpyruvate tautomerase PptA (4-oxalocrotonate tautomerase family)